MGNDVRSRVRQNFDEELMFNLAIGFSISFALTVLLVLVITPVHELLHGLGAIIEGGSIQSIIWIDLSAWFQAYIHPVTASSGEIGRVTATLPENPLFGGFIFYFLPYIVLLPLSIVMMLGDNLRYVIGGNGISNLWRLVGGPLFILNFGAFWTDAALYLGAESGVIPIPAILWQLIYFGGIVMGVVGSTVLIYVMDEANR